jgi:hypothetical protein
VYAVAVGDLTGDGYPDFVTANGDNWSVTVFRNAADWPTTLGTNPGWTPRANLGAVDLGASRSTDPPQAVAAPFLAVDASIPTTAARDPLSTGQVADRFLTTGSRARDTASLGDEWPEPSGEEVGGFLDLIGVSAKSYEATRAHHNLAR